jgi:hypothetical protein
MISRLGNVLYWASCLVAVACLVITVTMFYKGTDTSGIEAARRAGTSDQEILDQQRRSNPKIDDALKVGYTRSEILTYLVDQSRSRLAIPNQDEAKIIGMGAGLAVAIWLVGRAFKYVLAGR